MDEQQERCAALGEVKESLGLEVYRLYHVDCHHPSDEDVYRLAYRQPDGRWSPVLEEATQLDWVLFQTLVNARVAYRTLDAERLQLKTALDKIAAQRERWRKSKSKSRSIKNNPTRHDPRQVSLYGDGHVAELTEQISAE